MCCRSFEGGEIGIVSGTTLRCIPVDCGVLGIRGFGVTTRKRRKGRWAACLCWVAVKLEQNQNRRTENLKIGDKREYIPLARQHSFPPPVSFRREQKRAQIVVKTDGLLFMPCYHRARIRASLTRSQDRREIGCLAPIGHAFR